MLSLNSVLIYILFVLVVGTACLKHLYETRVLIASRVLTKDLASSTRYAGTRAFITSYSIPVLRSRAAVKTDLYLGPSEVDTIISRTVRPRCVRRHPPDASIENMPGWSYLAVRQILDHAGVTPPRDTDTPNRAVEIIDTWRTSGLIGVVLCVDGSVIKDYGDLSHAAKSSYKPFRTVSGREAHVYYGSSDANCLLVHIPYGASSLPVLSDYAKKSGIQHTSLSGSDEHKEIELLCDSGLFDLVSDAREIDLSGMSIFAAKYSRLWLDVLKNPAYSALPDQGSIRESTLDGRPVRSIWSDVVRAEVHAIQEIYREWFVGIVQKIERTHGICVIVNLRSQSLSQLTSTAGQPTPRVFVNLSLHSPAWLVDSVKEAFGDMCASDLSVDDSLSTYLLSGHVSEFAPYITLMFAQESLADPQTNARIALALVKFATLVNDQSRRQ